MSSSANTVPAAAKPVKIHEFTSPTFTGPEENLLLAVIIAPDRDDFTRKSLHLRSYPFVIELFRNLTPETRRMILDHLDLLVAEFKAMVSLEAVR